MDADLGTLHAPEAAAEIVDEGCRRVRERGQIDIVRCRSMRIPRNKPRDIKHSEVRGQQH
jgi:hypothetical protein